MEAADSNALVAKAASLVNADARQVKSTATASAWIPKRIEIIVAAAEASALPIFANQVLFVPTAFAGRAAPRINPIVPGPVSTSKQIV